MVSHNLPAQTTPFIGRTHELAEIATLLADPTCRLLTLVGPGGIGKTRLALEVATAQRDYYTEGICFAALQPLTSPDFILSTIASAVNFQLYPGGDPKQQLLNYLSNKSLLLILDNLEHLLDGVGLLSEILAAAPQVRLLATSRERLNLVEEWALEIRELKYPANEAETDVEAYDAVQLFVQQARRAHVGFALTSVQKPAVIRICFLVGGIPLGIELAAAWVRALPCEEIAREIERGLDILETPARNIEPRHRNMRAAFEPTWHRLPAVEKALFKRLAVFRGGFTRQAAEQVAGASLLALSLLVDKSLVRVDASGRYDLHELLRQYGEDKLQESSEDDTAARDAHLAYYAAFAAAQGEEMRGARMNEAIEATRVEYDNLLTAWHWACEHPEHHTFLWDFAFCLSWFVYQAHRHHEVSTVFEPALRALGQGKHDGQLVGVLIAFQSFLMFVAARRDEALVLLDQALPILDQLDDDGLRREAGLVLFMVSFACGGLSRFADHQRLGQRSSAVCRARGWRFELAYGLQIYQYPFLAYYLTADYDYKSDLHEARLLIEEALRIAQDIASTFVLGMASVVLGALAVREDNLVEAKQVLLKALRVLYSPPGLGAALLWLAEVALKTGEYHEARQWCQQGFQLIHHVGMRFNSARPLLLAAMEVLAGLGESERAAELVGWCKAQWGEKYFAALAKWQTTMHIDRLEGRLGSAVYAAAVTRGQAIDSDEVIPSLLGELNKLEHSAEKPSIVLIGSGDYHDPLTERELEVLRLMAEGLTNQEIAARLFLTVGTVKWYLHEIYSKLHVASRTQAVARARELNLLI